METTFEFTPHCLFNFHSKATAKIYHEKPQSHSAHKFAMAVSSVTDDWSSEQHSCNHFKTQNSTLAALLEQFWSTFFFEILPKKFLLFEASGVSVGMYIWFWNPHIWWLISFLTIRLPWCLLSWLMDAHLAARRRA